jgi:hypothetical protein
LGSKISKVSARNAGPVPNIEYATRKTLRAKPIVKTAAASRAHHKSEFASLE